MAGVGGAPDWLGYENALWELSEDLRALLRRERATTAPSPLMDAVAKLVADVRFGKGRQNFVLVRGEFGGPEYREDLAVLLDDDDIQAHVLSALVSISDGRHVVRAEKIAVSARSVAARRAAKRYLKRFKPG